MNRVNFFNISIGFQNYWLLNGKTADFKFPLDPKKSYQNTKVC